MIWLLISLSSAQQVLPQETQILQAVQQQEMSQTAAMLHKDFTNLQQWSGNSSRGYSKALFPTPSLLANLNVHKIDHSLLPNLEKQQQHDFIRIQTDSHHLTLGYTNQQFSAGLLSIHKDHVRPQKSPFAEDRLSLLFTSLDNIFQSCTKVTPLERDIYNNSIAWRGDDCGGINLFARYLPTEEYSLQVVLHSRVQQ